MKNPHARQSGSVPLGLACAAMTCTLHPPPPSAGMTGFLRLIWPPTYVQLIARTGSVRKHDGPGVR